MFPAASAGPGEHGLGHVVHAAELVHLLREPELRVGVEPLAEEPFGGLAGRGSVSPVRVASCEGQFLLCDAARSRCRPAGRRRPAAMRRREIAALLVEVGEAEGQVGVGLRRVDRLCELGEGVVLVVVPPEEGPLRARPGKTASAAGVFAARTRSRTWATRSLPRSSRR